MGPHHIGEIQEAKRIKELSRLKGRHQKAEDRATQGQDIGKNPFEKVNESQNQKQTKKDHVDKDGRVKSVLEKEKVKGEAGNHLHGWINPGNSLPTLTAFPSQKEIAEDGNILPGSDEMMAVGAA